MTSISHAETQGVPAILVTLYLIKSLLPHKVQAVMERTNARDRQGHIAFSLAWARGKAQWGFNASGLQCFVA
jgi:hypothetical protein